MAATAGREAACGLLLALGGVYVTQSLVSGVAMLSLPALLRAAGLSLQWVGLAALFMLPWGLKFLWSPWVEGWRRPVGSGRDRSTSLILAGQWLLALGLMAVALAGWGDRSALAIADGQLSGMTLALLAALWAAAMLTATIDIACDGFAVDVLAEGERGWGNMAQVGGSYLGLALGGAGFLVLAQARGWPLALLVAAAVIAALTIPLMRLGRRPLAGGEEAAPGQGGPGEVRAERGRAEQGRAAQRARPSLARAFARPPVRRGLVLVVGCGLGVRLAAGMVTPLLVDRGASLALIGLLNGLLGVSCGLLGALAGGWLVRGRGDRRAVILVVAAEAVVVAALAMAAAWQPPVAVLAVLLGLKMATMAAGFVAIYSLLMGWSTGDQAGVDFTLFQCVDALVAAFAGIAAGWIAHAWGYAACFGFAAACLIAAFLSLRTCLVASPGAGQWPEAQARPSG